MATEMLPIDWIREQCAGYEFDALGVYRTGDIGGTWPLTASSATELGDLLKSRGQLAPLPKEPAALANVLEVSVVDYLVAASQRPAGVEAEISITRGTERGYPDFELTGRAFGPGYHAVDVKVARRADTRDRHRTQSRITLYTGNTYFKWPRLHWPGTFRPFADYAGHIDVVVIYTLDESRYERVSDVEVIVQEPWRIASHQRSSTTREYIGAVDLITDLRDGRGEFASPEEFYGFWRTFPFRVSPSVQTQLQRLLDKQTEELEALRAMRDKSGTP